MTDTRDEAWEELRSRLAALGLKLKLHFEQEHEPVSEAAEGIREQLEKMGETVKEAFDALGNAATDEALQADAKQAARLLVDALEATFADVGTRLRDRLGRD